MNNFDQIAIYHIDFDYNFYNGFKIILIKF